MNKTLLITYSILSIPDHLALVVRFNAIITQQTKKTMSFNDFAVESSELLLHNFSWEFQFGGS
jgi:hypothetical protein